MFEVEKKFILTQKQKGGILEGAEFLSEKVFTDTYYDNDKFSLGSNDMWLRKRDDEFDLKIPMHESGDEMINKYHEVEGEMAIREIFAVPIIGSFEKDLELFGHRPFATFKNTRRKYKKEDFIIDIDSADFGDWKYELAEIKLVVETKDEMKKAEEKIYEFGKRHNLEIKIVQGKIVEFIKRKMPEAYERLRKEGSVY